MIDPANSAREGIRAEMQAIRNAMSAQERRSASRIACTRLVNLESFRRASTAMLYMPLAWEVDTTAIALRCFQAGKTVCVPSTNWNRHEITALEVTDFDDHFMETDEHGFRSPQRGRPVVPGSIDIVIVPGAAFDMDGGRLGQGGGAYYRYLARLRRSAISIGLAFDSQIIDAVPLNGCNTTLNAIVTDRRVMEVRHARTRR